MVEHPFQKKISPVHVERLIYALDAIEPPQKKPFVLPKITPPSEIIKIEDTSAVDTDFYVNEDELNEESSWQF